MAVKTGDREHLNSSAPTPLTGSPVQSEAIRGEEQVLRDIVASDVHQDVPSDHTHLRGVSPHAPRAREAGALG